MTLLSIIKHKQLYIFVQNKQKYLDKIDEHDNYKSEMTMKDEMVHFILIEI